VGLWFKFSSLSCTNWMFYNYLITKHFESLCVNLQKRGLMWYTLNFNQKIVMLSLFNNILSIFYKWLFRCNNVYPHSPQTLISIFVQLPLNNFWHKMWITHYDFVLNILLAHRRFTYTLSYSFIFEKIFRYYVVSC